MNRDRFDYPPHKWYAPMRLLWLPDVVRAAGLEPVEVPGWERRGKEFTEPIRGLIAHHTATSAKATGDYPSLGIVRDGRSDLPGPLAQLGLGRSGKVYVIASGRANHAGAGSYGPIKGNADTIGIEAEHPGTSGTAWPSFQLDCYYRLLAALADKANVPTQYVIGHKEWTTRKIDPIGLNMNDFRKRVETYRGANMADVGQRKGVDEIFKEAWNELIKEGVFTEHTDPDKNPRNEELATFLHRFLYKVVVDLTKNGGGGTVDSVARESAASAHRRLDAIKKAL